MPGPPKLISTSPRRLNTAANAAAAHEALVRLKLWEVIHLGEGLRVFRPSNLFRARHRPPPTSALCLLQRTSRRTARNGREGISPERGVVLD